MLKVERSEDGEDVDGRFALAVLETLSEVSEDNGRLAGEDEGALH